MPVNLAGLEPLQVAAALGLIAAFLAATAVKIAATLSLLVLPFLLLALRLQKAMRPTKLDLQGR